jgi:head-tail adaptor
MPDPTGAGKFIELVAFDERAPVDDGYGNSVAGDWQEQFRLHAAFIHMRGSEPVQAARLESRQPMIMRVRICADAARIGTEWQARDVRRAVAYNIRTITNDNSRAFLDLLVEQGVATG